MAGHGGGSRERLCVFHADNNHKDFWDIYGLIQGIGVTLENTRGGTGTAGGIKLLISLEMGDAADTFGTNVITEVLGRGEGS